MKTVLLGLVFLAATTATFANTANANPNLYRGEGVPSVTLQARDHTCADLAYAIQRYGEVNIMSFSIFGGTFYAAASSCPYNTRPVGRYVTALGGESCFLRWTCESIPNDR